MWNVIGCHMRKFLWIVPALMAFQTPEVNAAVVDFNWSYTSSVAGVSGSGQLVAFGGAGEYNVRSMFGVVNGVGPTAIYVEPPGPATLINVDLGQDDLLFYPAVGAPPSQLDIKGILFAIPGDTMLLGKVFALFSETGQDYLQIFGGCPTTCTIASTTEITFSASPEATPLPATLPLFATGLGALGVLGCRRKRNNALAAA
jgi:hypothetical protein